MRYLLLLSLATLLTGGQNDLLPPKAEHASTPLLTGPWLSLDYKVENVSMDSSGRYLLAAGNSLGAELYERSSLQKIRTFKLETPYGLVNGSGFIDSNTLYFGYTEIGALEKHTVVDIWSVEPPRKLYTHEFESRGDRPVVANSQYVVYPDAVIKWRDGSDSLRALHAHPGEVGGYALTDSGRVFSRNLLGKTLLLHDPKTDQRWYWSTDIMPFAAAITRSERHVIAIDDTGACRVWRMPEIESLDRCGWGTPFTQKWTGLVVAPHAERFAVSVENRVRVYSLEPYKLINEFRLATDVDKLALTDEGRLAVVDSQGHLSLWDSATGTILGQAEPGKVRELTFQGEVRVLAVASKGEQYGLHLYDIPPPSAVPSDSPR